MPAIASGEVLIDRFGRPLRRLRISVTERCNHACVFCHREGITWNADELSAADWDFVADVAASLGFVEAKLTGGEPLMRDDVHEIARSFSSRGMAVSLTTNGSRLAEFAARLAEAGVARVNVSVHSLRPETFRKITGGDLQPVLEGIRAAIESGLEVKLDFVVTSWNADELANIIEFASSVGARGLNIIELIPLGMPHDVYSKLHAGLEEAEKLLERTATRKFVRDFQSRPSYVLPGGLVVELVKGFCNPAMCAACDRLRITPDGKLKTCLFRNDNLIDARPHIASRDREGLIEDFRRAAIIREPLFKFPGARLGNG